MLYSSVLIFPDVLEGNLKSVMRIVLALAAHFKPSANQRTASGSGRSLTQAGSGHNPHSAVALAQGAAAALVSARLDASLPVRTTRIHGYANNLLYNLFIHLSLRSHTLERLSFTATVQLNQWAGD